MGRKNILKADICHSLFHSRAFSCSDAIECATRVGFALPHRASAQLGAGRKRADALFCRASVGGMHSWATTQPMTSRYSTHGEHDSFRLVKEWAQRSTYFFRICHEEGRPDVLGHTPADIHAEPHTLEYLDWVLALPPRFTAMDRAFGVNASEPRNPSRFASPHQPIPK